MKNRLLPFLLPFAGLACGQAPTPAPTAPTIPPEAWTYSDDRSTAQLRVEVEVEGRGTQAYDLSVVVDDVSSRVGVVPLQGDGVDLHVDEAMDRARVDNPQGRLEVAVNGQVAFLDARAYDLGEQSRVAEFEQALQRHSVSQAIPDEVGQVAELGVEQSEAMTNGAVGKALKKFVKWVFRKGVNVSLSCGSQGGRMRCRPGVKI